METLIRLLVFVFVLVPLAVALLRLLWHVIAGTTNAVREGDLPWRPYEGGRERE
jgi:hypothetical protein